MHRFLIATAVLVALVGIWGAAAGSAMRSAAAGTPTVVLPAPTPFARPIGGVAAAPTPPGGALPARPVAATQIATAPAAAVPLAPVAIPSGSVSFTIVLEVAPGKGY